MSDRVLVWGACGFIGRHLVRGLLADDQEVGVLTFDRSRYDLPQWASMVRWFELCGTPEDGAVLRDAVAFASRIYNLAGTSGAVASNRDPIWSLETICRAQLEFLETCAQAGRCPQVVFSSSRLVYGRAAHLPVGEDAPLAPQSLYAAHKICVENYHRIYAQRGAVGATVCRISNPFGADQDRRPKSYGFLNQLVRQGRQGEPLTIYGSGRQLRDYVYIRDLVSALLLAGRPACEPFRILNIGRGIGISLLDAALEVNKLTGGPGIRLVPWPSEHELVESGDFVADISAARAVLGFDPKYDFVSGLLDTLREDSLPFQPADRDSED